MPGEPSLLTVQVYVEVGSLPEALEQAKKFCELTGELGFPTKCHVERYWKIPEWYGITLPLRVEKGKASFESAKHLLGEGWMVAGTADSPEAVWDRRMHGNFLLPLARWCHLQLERSS